MAWILIDTETDGLRGRQGIVRRLAGQLGWDRVLKWAANVLGPTDTAKILGYEIEEAEVPPKPEFAPGDPRRELWEILEPIMEERLSVTSQAQRALWDMAPATLRQAALMAAATDWFRQEVAVYPAREGRPASLSNVGSGALLTLCRPPGAVGSQWMREVAAKIIETVPENEIVWADKP